MREMILISLYTACIRTFAACIFCLNVGTNGTTSPKTSPPKPATWNDCKKMSNSSWICHVMFPNMPRYVSQHGTLCFPM